MEELKLKLAIDILKKDRLLLLKLFIFIFGILSIIILFVEPKYPISSSIIVEEKDNSMSATSITMLMSGQSQKILNEIEILKSRTLFDNVINELNLTYKIERNNNFFISYLFRVISGKPPFEGSIYAVNIPDKLKETESEIIITDNGYRISNRIETKECQFSLECSYMGGSLILNRLGDISAGTSFSAEYVNIIKRREQLSGDFVFATIGDTKESNVFQIVYNSSEPMLGVRIIEEFDKKYVDKKLEWNSNDADDQQKFMGKILDDVKKELDAKSQKLAVYQKDNLTVLPDLQFTEIMKRNVEIEKEIAILKLQFEIVSKYNDSIDIEKIAPVPAPIVIDDLSVQMTVKAHNELIAKYSTLASNFTENHPLILQSKSDIRQARVGLKELLQKSADNYSKSIAILKKQSDLIFSTIENLPKNLMNIADLQREVLITEKLYAFLAQKIYEARISQTVEIAPIRIMDKPTHLVKKAFPSFSISFSVILILSFIFSIFIFVLYEIFRKNIVSPYEVLISAKKNDVFHNSVASGIEKFVSDFIYGRVFNSGTVVLFDTSGQGIDINKLQCCSFGQRKISCFDIFINNGTDGEADPLKCFIKTEYSPAFSYYKCELNTNSSVSLLESLTFQTMATRHSSKTEEISLVIVREITPDSFSENFFHANPNILFIIKVLKTDRIHISSIKNVFNGSEGIKKILLED